MPNAKPAHLRDKLYEHFGFRRVRPGQLHAVRAADDFDDREKAPAALARRGERAERGLRRVADGPLSPEARRRVETVLELIAKAKQLPECVQALDYVESHGAPEKGELLRIVAEGEPGAWLTRQAKERPAQRRGRHPSAGK